MAGRRSNFRIVPGFVGKCCAPGDLIARATAFIKGPASIAASPDTETAIAIIAELVAALKGAKKKTRKSTGPISGGIDKPAGPDPYLEGIMKKIKGLLRKCIL